MIRAIFYKTANRIPVLFVIKEIISNISGLYKLSFKVRWSTASARYCYSVWLRHLVVAHKNGLRTPPKIIAELGPGDSLGTGLAALLSGSKMYYALDVGAYVNKKRNCELFDDLIKLFKNRERIPDENEYPEIGPRLESYEFPRHIITETILNQTLSEKRISEIRNSLNGLNKESGASKYISYIVPWHKSGNLPKEPVDILFSQAVLEHIDNLKDAYTILNRFLAPNGYMSHQIDLRSHGTAREWNGHWSYSDFLWRLMRGRRSWMLNREPYSAHSNLLKKCGFEILCDQKITDTTGIKRAQLAKRFVELSDIDLATSGVYFLAIKK